MMSSVPISSKVHSFFCEHRDPLAPSKYHENYSILKFHEKRNLILLHFTHFSAPRQHQSVVETRFVYCSIALYCSRKKMRILEVCEGIKKGEKPSGIAFQRENVLNISHCRSSSSSSRSPHYNVANPPNELRQSLTCPSITVVVSQQKHANAL